MHTQSIDRLHLMHKREPQKKIGYRDYDNDKLHLCPALPPLPPLYSLSNLSTHALVNLTSTSTSTSTSTPSPPSKLILLHALNRRINHVFRHQ